MIDVTANFMQCGIISEGLFSTLEETGHDLMLLQSIHCRVFLCHIEVVWER